MSQNKVFVGGISFNTTESALADFFRSFGEIVSCKIITNRETGRSRGFAFVEFSSQQEAESSISNGDGKELDGRTIRVSLANKTSSSSGSGGRGGRGGNFNNRNEHSRSRY